jgi:hypothetical protein
MKRVILGVLCASAAAAASAQFKCTDAQGRVTFQQTACALADQQQKRRGSGWEASAAKPPAEQREQRTRELQQQIAATEDGLERRKGQMTVELDLLKLKQMKAKTITSGSGTEQAYGAQMEQVTAKYKAQNDADNERLKQLRAELAQLSSVKR